MNVDIYNSSMVRYNQYLNFNTELYFLSKDGLLNTEGKYGATCICLLILSMFLELLKFTKWYVSTRRRITHNCLTHLVEFKVDPKTRKKQLKKTRLNVFERLLIIVLQFLIKGIGFLYVCLILETYNMGYVIIISVGLMIGNLVFGLL